MLQCLQCVAVCMVRCNVLRCVAVCCSALPCVAVCCRVLQCDVRGDNSCHHVSAKELYRDTERQRDTATHYNALQQTLQ